MADIGAVLFAPSQYYVLFYLSCVIYLVLSGDMDKGLFHKNFCTTCQPVNETQANPTNRAIFVPR